VLLPGRAAWLSCGVAALEAAAWWLPGSPGCITSRGVSAAGAAWRCEEGAAAAAAYFSCAGAGWG
jgi:hypothetical protein